MALDNYADIIAAPPNWTGRADLSSRIPEFLELVEAKINRKLRTKDMETKNASFSITGEYVAVPTGFGGVSSWHLNTNPKQPLELLPPDQQSAKYSNTDQPKYYAIEGSNFRFAPVPGGTYSSTLTYFLQVPALTASATTNWLLTANPDVYLYGLNAEAAAFTKDFEGAQGWLAMMYRALEEVVLISNKDKRSGPPLATRPDSPVY